MYKTMEVKQLSGMPNVLNQTVFPLKIRHFSFISFTFTNPVLI